MSDFIKIHKKNYKINGINDPNNSNEENIKLLNENLISKLKIIKSSTLYKEIFITLKEIKFIKIRCLALGSPSQDQPSLYQLALLILLVEEFNLHSENISLYDPIFNELDLKLLTINYRYRVEKNYDQIFDQDEILYFLPHAPLNLTNEIIDLESPKLLLANNIITHTDRLTNLELFEKYPTISKIINYINNLDQSDKLTSGNLDGFQKVINNNSKRKLQRKNKYNANNVKTIDYSQIVTYFEKVELKSFKHLEEGPWLNSFSDIAFHRLI
ncbi:hypothetical protein WICMUC_005885 [Wickerhamomyces mucosus]|uniref:SRR1-like domain-containing protein n=1 Tax=Wickerhamomyces mucosus TaxID=1378264 RepID=A0A9P8T2R5_9ASCO|nr:hypothetical protein WICMUC_005885 [Wickerhamomyces mucosus]